MTNTTPEPKTREFLVTFATAQDERINVDMRRWIDSGTKAPLFFAEADGIGRQAKIKLPDQENIKIEIERRFGLADPGNRIYKIEEITEL